MENIHSKGFFLQGISVRTTNENGQAAKDIGELWGRFMADNVQEKIEDRITDSVYCIYTDYESDHTGPYTAVLGHPVSSMDNMPAGLIGVAVPASEYVRYIASGRLPDCVGEAWQEIWNTPLNRTYKADFDVWGPKAQNPENAEVDIYVGVM
ncbi:GyrI-like domain-containing protein [Mucilaginibacter flavus]|uniref:GyrI-like domain-containing protein n=1 Tax=Mucilaginibacter flavus TaxID=931504 RepID=UPI0025B3C7B4|nr:GyrI-like domain-containing protein [Mucilaginibacter flavus]MDN3582688.1 GyrI-like domain-containing protein [Mucilaginibacter flavus]